MTTTGSVGYPLSPQQEQAWLQLADSPAAGALLQLRVAGPLDAARLEEALKRVVERHEILRTTFVRQPARRLPLQIIDAESSIAFRTEDLSSLDERSQAGRVNEVVTSLGTNASLDEAPVMRVALLRLREQKHVLAVSLPSLCADAETLHLLAAELIQSYMGAALEGDPVQYADFAEWQRQEIDSTEPGAAMGRAHWRRAVGSAPPPVLLGTRQIDSARRFSIGSVQRTLQPHVSQALEALAGTMGAPLDRVTFAAWSAFLARVSGGERIRVRWISSGRINDEVANALGLYAKALPIALEIGADDTVAEVVRRAASAVAEALGYEAAHPCDDASGQEAGFEWIAHRSYAAGDVLWTADARESHITALAAKLTCTPAPEGLRATLVYDSRFIEQADASRLLDQFAALVASLATGGDARIGTLSLGDGDARTARAGKGAPYVSLHAWFEAQARTTPDATAVAGEDASLTYAQLDAQANQVAQWLAAAGVNPGDCVGICGERTATLLVALSGALKAGAAYVPVAPDAPATRVAAQLAESAAAAVLVTDSRAREVLTSYSGPVLDLSDLSAWRSLPATSLDVLISGDAVAYVLYTSGSTGQPKGVCVRHSNLVAYTASIVEALDAAGIDRANLRYATVSALTADLGNTCIFPPLVSGGSVHMVPSACTLDGAALAAYVREHSIDVMKITPSHLAAVLDETGGVLPRRLVVLGGEALTWDLVAAIRARGTCAVWNHYGPTETTVGALVYPVPSDGARVPTRTVPIGRPLGHATVAVVDAAGEPVPLGVPGELWIGGAGVAAGYVARPELTAERFVTPRWASADRMYRTGDRVWMQSGGVVEFLGRADDQVKIRGYRVEPGEVEHVLKALGGVRDAAVVAVADTPADRHLVAYVVADAGVANADLTSGVRERLPDYMVPGALVRVGTLPRLGNGKVDRRQLVAQALAAPARATDEAAAPRTPVETTLVDIWQTLLGRAPIGIHDNFFELGGHSLLATRLVARLRREFDVQLPLRAIFEHPTVASLGATIARRVEQPTEDVERLLADVDRLDESEVQALLEQLDAE